MVVSFKFMEADVNVMMVLQGLEGGRQKVPFRVLTLLGLLGNTGRTSRAFAGVEFNRRNRSTRIKKSGNMTSGE